MTAEIEARLRGQTISIQVDTSLELKTDRQLVLAALGNLVQNAMKYSKSGGNIVIIAKAAGTNAEIEVNDQCGGIDPSTMKEMFKPFTQFNEDTSGPGLGLAIARKAIARCGGEILAQNITGGCSVKIILPKLEKTIRGLPSVV